jgi:hypothetical protein
MVSVDAQIAVSQSVGRVSLLWNGEWADELVNPRGLPARAFPSLADSVAPPDVRFQESGAGSRNRAYEVRHDCDPPHEVVSR